MRRIPSSPPALVLAFLLLLLAVPPRPLDAQNGGNLRDLLSELFIFGSGEDPLVLGGSIDPNNPEAIRVHGLHFVPAAVAENGSLIGFVTSAISASIGSVPIGATSGGVTFRFEGGVPVKTSTSAGPIFAERAQTLGRGRVLVGVGRSSFRFATLRGVPMDDIELTFTHQNVDFAGCDTIHGGDCAQMGLPLLENEIMPFRLDLDLSITVTTLYVTYGLWDRIDVGLVLPLVSTRLSGGSVAQIIPFSGPEAAHFFEGTPEDPGLSASRTVSGSAFGLGDVAARTKIALRESTNHALAILGEARFATGSEEDLLGAGAFSARGIMVLSGRIGAFAPHVNVGYIYHGSKAETRRNDAVLATVGFDHLMSEWVTLAADVVSELQVGDSRLELPAPVDFQAPFHRTVRTSSIPDVRDDLVSGSFGFKVTLPSGFTGVANALVPLNAGGMRARVIYTAGLEVNF